MKRCLEGQHSASAAFDQLYARHAEPILAFLYSMHRQDEHAARDALQETFFRFYNALGSLKLDQPLRPWLYRVARNISLDHYKRKGTQHEIPHPPQRLGELGQSGGENPVSLTAERERAGILRGAVQKLPPEELAVFLLKRDQGLTYQEIADALSCSLRTAKYRMKSALESIGRECERLGVGQ